MTALDLLLLMGEYRFIRKFVRELVVEYHHIEKNKPNMAIYLEDSE